MAKKLKYQDKPSHEQQKWEFAANAHKRAKEVLAMLKRANLEGRAEYWESRIAQIEQEYPSLRKEHAQA